MALPSLRSSARGPAAANASRRSLQVHASAQTRKELRDAPRGARTLGNLALGGAALLAAAAPARAEDVDAVDSAVVTATEVVKATGAAVKTGIDLVSAGVRALQQGYEVAAPVIKQGVDAVAPVVQEAAKVTSEVAGPVVAKAVPSAQAALSSAIKSAGVDVSIEQVTKTAASGAAQATPLLSKAAEFVTTTPPTLLAEYALGAVALFYLAPPLLGAAFGSLRGYGGELSAAQALDAVNNDGNTAIIDLRSEAEKDTSGLADVPSGASGKLIEVEFAVTSDKRLRGQLKDPNYIEAQVTALQIAALKRIGRGTKIILLDRYGSASRAVAKELGKVGFGKVYVVAGGFDGRGGWVQSKLLVKPTANDYGAGAAAGGLLRTLSTRAQAPSGRKALPAPSK